MKILKIISRIIVGVVFIFSGFVKAVDPLGTVYKFGDYLNAFNLSFLTPLCLLFAIGLCTLEFLGGISVLFNIKPKIGIWTVTLLMAVFTPLTFVLALTNPVSDCGCFGDAIHLTNWQTFFKNVVLAVPTAFLFIKRNEQDSNLKSKSEWTIIVASTLLFLIFIFYNLRYLPVIDFLPYKVGTYIPEKMIVPEGMPVDQYETTFIYEKEGKQEEFTLENYPANDTTWKFVDARTKLVSKGYEPPIHDLTFTNENGEDKTDRILASQNYTMFMISKKLGEVKAEKIREGLSFGEELKSLGIDFYLLTSSSSGEVHDYIMPKIFTGIPVFEEKDDFYLVDEITLKTMVRSNPGFMLIKEGTIIAKWSWAGRPDIETIINILNN
ncbi:MAG: BT_3928 family protein [Bacteroidales bacterium]|jgi:uncharacterized membrane protein YphA (DoxX/SURF4 family)